MSLPGGTPVGQAKVVEEHGAGTLGGGVAKEPTICYGQRIPEWLKPLLTDHGTWCHHGPRWL